MKKYSNIFFLVAGFLLLITSCSRTKDAALNRGFHAMNTQYNILYIGDLALQQGLEELNANYVDDYWKRLPIEPLKVDELALPGMRGSVDNSNASFEKAEEKAVKAIQKHGMNIAGIERNSQIDQAYLLLGKSRYYSQRFVPAMEAFTYVIKNYPTADLNTETRIWRAKTLLRINNEELALQTLEGILNKEKIYEEKDIEDAHTAMAMVYTAMDSTHLVVHHLKQAVRTDYNKEQRARNLFILGQIYRELHQLDSSDIVFKEIIEMKRIPYKYQIHSEIELAKNVTDSTDILALNANLTKLINNRENRPYLDELHYQAAMLYERHGQFAIADLNYRKSVHTRYAKQFQQGLSYERLGDLRFDNADFVMAGAYYDSVMSLPQDRNTKRIRRLERKRKNLDDVIYNEGIAKESDSILRIVAMSEDEQADYFQTYVDHLLTIKEKEEAIENNRQNSNTGFGGFSDDFTSQTSSDGKWYFYNVQLSGFGQQQFFQKWGNRPYEENWRMSDKGNFGSGNNNEEIVQVDVIEESEKYKVETYLDRIPTDQNTLDSISAERNKAYYNLGLIYKEQFKELEIAADRFESLLTFIPEEKYILPTKYHLYKIYEELGSSRADFYQNEIVTNHADSKYAKIITNPESVIASEDNEQTPEMVYEDVFCDYEGEYFESVIEQSDEAIKQYEDLPILAKFELLRAFAIGKTQGAEAFREALNFVVLNYSNTDEGKKAMEVIESIKNLN